MMELLTSPEAWIALLTLSAMEIVLGIDNIIFISIVVGRVDDLKLRERLRKVGLMIAVVMRIGLLFVLSWIMGLTKPIFSLMGNDFSGRDLILLGGGLFLMAKSAHEIFAKVEGHEEDGKPKAASSSTSSFWILVQIALLDMVFSLDSVITAVGMSKDIPVMIAANLIAVAVMLIFAKGIGDFVDRHPSVKVLALSFLLMIGALLVAEGFGRHLPKGYLYFAMAYALGVELINMRMRKKSAK